MVGILLSPIMIIGSNGVGKLVEKVKKVSHITPGAIFQQLFDTKKFFLIAPKPSLPVILIWTKWFGKFSILGVNTTRFPECEYQCVYTEDRRYINAKKNMTFLKIDSKITPPPF